MARNDRPRSFQSWTEVDATPNDFVMDAGWYGLTLHATTWGTATLKRLIPGTATYVTVLAAINADGYATVQLPAGQYQLTLTGADITLSGMIELITPGRR